MPDDDYEEILGVRYSMEDTAATTIVHCLFRYYDYTIRLIVVEFDWTAGGSTGGWTAANAYQMNHPIYVYDTTAGKVLVTPLTMTATLEDGNYENTVSPWNDFWIITLR